MKKCILALTLATVCLAAYGQRSWRKSSDCDDDERYERNARWRSDDDDDDDHRKRRSTIVISGRGSRWKVDRYEDQHDDRDRERKIRRSFDDDRRRDRLPMFTFGPKVGVNYSTLVKNPVDVDADYQTGYHIGGFMRFNVRRAYIQPEILYSTKGGTLNLPDNPGSGYAPGAYSVTINAIDVPFLLGAQLIRSPAFNLRVLAGPSASFIVNGTGLDNFLNENESTSDYLKKIVMGYQAGVGVDLGAITLDARYEWTVMGVADLERAELGKPRSGMLQASVGIKIF